MSLQSAKDSFLLLCDSWGILDLKAYLEKKGGFIFGEFVFSSKMYQESIDKDDGKWEVIAQIDMALPFNELQKFKQFLVGKAGFEHQKTTTNQIVGLYTKGSHSLYLYTLGPGITKNNLTNATILDFINTHTELSLEQVWYHKNRVFGTKLAKEAWNTNHFHVVAQNTTKWSEWIKLMERVRYFENQDTFDMTFDANLTLWKKIFATYKYAPNDIKPILRWNAQFGSTEERESNIVKFLYAIKPNKKHVYTLEDIKVYAVPGKNEYMWRYPWSVRQKENFVGNLKSPVRPSAHWDDEFMTNYTKNSQTEVKLASFAILNQTTFPSVYLQGKLPQTCDYVTQAEDGYVLNDFVKQGCACNIVFFHTMSGAGLEAVCMTREDFITRIDSYYECGLQDKLESVQQDLEIIRINLGTFDYIPKTAFISRVNFNMILASDEQFFVVRDAGYTMNLTVSKTALVKDADWTSADHCQDRSNKNISFVFPVHANSVRKVIEVMQPTHVMRILALKPAEDEEPDENSETEEQEEKFEKEEKVPEEEEETDLGFGEPEEEEVVFHTPPALRSPYEENVRPRRERSAFDDDTSGEEEEVKENVENIAPSDYVYATPPRVRSAFTPPPPESESESEPPEAEEEKAALLWYQTRMEQHIRDLMKERLQGPLDEDIRIIDEDIRQTQASLRMVQEGELSVPLWTMENREQYFNERRREQRERIIRQLESEEKSENQTEGQRWWRAKMQQYLDDVTEERRHVTDATMLRIIDEDLTNSRQRLQDVLRTQNFPMYIQYSDRDRLFDRGRRLERDAITRRWFLPD